jgi:hypothetical protein
MFHVHNVGGRRRRRHGVSSPPAIGRACGTSARPAARISTTDCAVQPNPAATSAALLIHGVSVTSRMVKRSRPNAVQ